MAGNCKFQTLVDANNASKAAAEFIDQDRVGIACFMLSGAYRRCDGEPRPLDFIEGEAVPQLMVMIEDLMAQLDCN